MQKVSAKKIKILVADDHPVVRKGLQSCLARQDRLKIVGEASDGDEALKKTRELSPDVVLMDISMPGMNGLAVTEVLRKDHPDVKVLVLSVHNNRDYVFRIIQAGAHGFISKEAPPDELLRAIESVYSGEPFFSPEIAKAALNQLVSSGGKKDPFAQLTGRERDKATRKLPIGSASACARLRRTANASCADSIFILWLVSPNLPSPTG